MSDLPRVEDAPPTPVPAASRALAAAANPLYRLFDWLYGSGYNPLYRSGTLAVGFLFILLGSGLYLSFFYSVSDPYASLTDIENQIWLGRWIRSLHRYTTVATVIAIGFHVLQLLVQGKCWGPRTLAWVSGVLLLLMFFVSAWTGYVMVWDLHGQKTALAGTELFAAIPLLRDVAVAAFDGTSAIPAGFFFMNLFLHVALPVVMIMFLWVHTARLSRAVWFPIRAIMVWSTVGLVLLSIFWPAPLLDRANLLRLVGRIPTDASVGLWISLLGLLGAIPTWGFLILATLALSAIPWIWRPRREETRPISQVIKEDCSGCTQCARDCPYEAIRMIPRDDGKRLIAEITPEHCVSCGICAASCADFAIGPPGRTALDQRARVSSFCSTARQRDTKLEMILVACSNNSKLIAMLGEHTSNSANTTVYPVECCGCMHTEVIEQMLTVSRGLVLIGCPARNCFNRDGGELLTQRIFEKRVPFLARDIDRNRLLITAFSEAESQNVTEAIDRFKAVLNDSTPPLLTHSALLQRSRALLTSALLLGFCAFAAQFPLGADPQMSLIRVAGTLPSFLAEECRAPNADELKDTPLHMRPREVCHRIPLSYNLQIILDSEQLLTRTLDTDGRIDKPLLLDVEQEVSSGSHRLEVRLTPTPTAPLLSCSAEVTLQRGQIFLAFFDREKEKLICGERVQIHRE